MTELRMEIGGKPQPKQRARRGKGGHWYTPRPTRSYQQRVAWLAHDAVLRLRRRPAVWPTCARYAVTLDVYMPDRRKRDGDNVAKAILDGANGILWDDDSQVTETTVRMHVDRERPRVEVAVRVVEGQGVTG